MGFVWEEERRLECTIEIINRSCGSSFVTAGMVYSINDCRSSDNNRMGYPFDNGEEGAGTCLGDERA